MPRNGRDRQTRSTCVRENARVYTCGRGACALMRCKIVPDYLPALHHELHTLQLSNVGNRISSDADEIGKFPRLNRPDAILPAQHFCSIRRDCAKDVERRHSGIMQMRKHCCRGLAPRFSRIEPAHIRSGRELHSRLQYSLSETGHLMPPSVVGGGQLRYPRGRQHYARLGNLCKKSTPKGWRYVEEDSLVAHHLELLVGHIVSMLDGVCSPINRRLDAACTDGVSGNLQVLPVSFFEDRRHFRQC